jgi:serine protease AprX
MVIDADASMTGEQPMTTMVFRQQLRLAGLSFRKPQYDTVSSPASAKNVIAVGATESYEPVTGGPPLDCRPGDSVFDGYEEDSKYDMNIARVARFSGRGAYFAPYPNTKAAHNVRVKPDLVAPGVRVFSVVPYQFESEYPGHAGSSACTAYYPAGSYYSYGSGTSFAAPVVSGVAALKRKWFLDRGTDPSPSLVKASLIATADSLGGQAGNDHRPSPVSGWGRVNLNRATDWAQRFYVKDNAGLAVATGQQRSWTRTVGNPALPTLIVLVWSDPPSGLVSHSQAPLVNDLQLKVTGAGTYVGNSFNENLTGTDNGFSYRYFFAPFLNDTMNTVEAVFLPANTFTTGQQLTIQVTGMNVTQGPQKFAVYAYNLQPTS